MLALNNRAELVGFTEQTAGDPASKRAVRWQGAGSATDLNTRLHRAPPGLVLTSAKAVNDRGMILAESNAGLVLLRPGKNQSAAPVLGPITTPAGDTFAVNSTGEFSVAFVGTDAARAYVASVAIDDGCAQTAPALRQVRGHGDVSIRHAFCKAGAFYLKVTLADAAGNSAQVQRRLVVGDGVAAAPAAQEAPRR